MGQGAWQQAARLQGPEACGAGRRLAAAAAALRGRRLLLAHVAAGLRSAAALCPPVQVTFRTPRFAYLTATKGVLSPGFAYEDQNQWWVDCATASQRKVAAGRALQAAASSSCRAMAGARGTARCSPSRRRTIRQQGVPAKAAAPSAQHKAPTARSCCRQHASHLQHRARPQLRPKCQLHCMATGPPGPPRLAPRLAAPPAAALRAPARWRPLS